jgi:hypothetical protein
MKRRVGRRVNCETVKIVSLHYPRTVWRDCGEKKKLDNLCQDKNLETPFTGDVRAIIFRKLPLSNSNLEA